MTMSAPIRPSGWTSALEHIGGGDWSLPAPRLVTLVRSATVPRLLFNGLIAAPALMAAPAAPLAAWLAALVAWELALRPALEDWLIRGEAAQDTHRLAAVHLLGSALYVVFPFLVWNPDQPIGMVLATIWVCATANHAFVYLAANRLVLFSGLAPLTIACLLAPITAVPALSLTALTGSLALVVLILVSALFGRDRRVLLKAFSAEASARTEADAANAAKSRFLANVSHELRTPINAIIGYAELIEESGGHDVAGDAGKIRIAGWSLLEQINTVLEVSKLENGDMALRPHRCHLSEIIQAAGARAIDLAAANGNALQMRIGDLGIGRIDSLQLARCLARLLDNAAKFTRNGEITLSAQRQKAERGDVLLITVSDTGIGIPADLQERVFEPFFQADSSEARRFEGAGLGLSHARLIARLMGGDIRCRSEVGVGSVFELEIPLEPAAFGHSS